MNKGLVGLQVGQAKKNPDYSGQTLIVDFVSEENYWYPFWQAFKGYF